MKFNTSNTQNPDITQLILPILQDDNLAERCSQLAEKYSISAEMLQNDFKADLKEIKIIYTNTQKIYLLGLGKSPAQKEWVATFRSFFHQQKINLKGIVGIDFNHLAPKFLENAVNGIVLGKYSVQLYKTDKKTEDNFFEQEAAIEFYLPDATENQVFIQRGQAIAETQMRILDLVNAPANHKNPQTLVDFALESGKANGFSVQILAKDELEKQGLKALLSVSEGSKNPPFLIMMEYKPAENLQKIGLVGKGVTFDTGGTSLKPSTNMHFMKSDMGGAGAVLGAMELTAQFKLPIHLIGVIPTTENFIDSHSTKPGDVIGSYLGKTIEVIDTDAEGRLILADGLTYLNRNFQPEILIDLATLTGSIVQTLGYEAAGLFSNNDVLAERLLKISQETGEKLWRMPLWDDYKEDISSDVADLRNYSGKPIAGAISAAKFLEVFTENHANYAHLDIAGVAFGDSEFAKSKSATAYGVRLLFSFLEDLIK